MRNNFFIILVSLLGLVCIVPGCGKQQTPQQRYDQSYEVVQYIDDVYQQESKLIAEQERTKSAIADLKKELLKYVAENPVVAPKTSFWSSGEYYYDNNVPLYNYLSKIKSDDAKLKKQLKLLAKNSLPTAQELIKRIKDLQTTLDLIKYYLQQTKDYLEEKRYIDLKALATQPKMMIGYLVPLYV